MIPTSMSKNTCSVFKSSLLFLLVSGSASVVQAQDFVLGEILVHGSTSDGANLESSISSEFMREHNKETVGAALAMMPGVHMSKVGPRNEQMIHVRGFDLRQVPVFVDGVPVYVPYDGYVDLGRFNTFDLARIDVAKGFSSLMHGPNALGGAINLISRKPAEGLEGEIGAGSTFSNNLNNTGQRVFANLGGATDNFYFQAGVSYLDNDSFRLPDSFKPTAAEDGGERNNSANTDKKYNVKLAWTPNETDEYALAYVSQQGEKGNPPYAGNVPGVALRYWQWPYWDKDSVYFISRTAIGEHELKTRVYHDTYGNGLYSYDDASYTTQTRPYAFRSFYDDRTTGFSTELALKVNDTNTLRTSWHWKDDVHREANAGEPWSTIRDVTDYLAAENTTQISPALALVTGASYERRRSLTAERLGTDGLIFDMPRDSNSATSYQAGIQYALTDSSQVNASVAKRNRFATIKDRYSFRFGTAIPNPSLKSESAIHYELGYRQSLADTAYWSVNAFLSDTDDMIQSVRIAPTACTSAPCSQMQNIGEVRTQGVELGVGGQIFGVQTGFNYTFLDRDNRTASQILLIDSPEHVAALYASTQVGSGIALTASVQASSERITSSDGVQRVAGFSATDLKASYEFSSQLRIEAGVSNVFDRLYQYAEGFPEAGRNYYTNINWSF